MTSPEFSYERSAFRCLEPGAEITVAGETYILKEDLTIDLPYGVDIYDLQMPPHSHSSVGGLDMTI